MVESQNKYSLFGGKVYRDNAFGWKIYFGDCLSVKAKICSIRCDTSKKNEDQLVLIYNWHLEL